MRSDARKRRKKKEEAVSLKVRCSPAVVIGSLDAPATKRSDGAARADEVTKASDIIDAIIVRPRNTRCEEETAQKSRIVLQSRFLRVCISTE